MDLHLRDKVVAITGGSKGIGQAIAYAFAEEGANVAICARGEDSLNQTALELKKKGVSVYSSRADVSDPEELDAFLEGARDALGRVDILINNVSGFGMTDDEKGWNDSLQIDVMPSVRATWKVVPWMQASGGGSIVHISSISGLESGWPPAYAAAKAALISHAKTLAISLAPEKIRVNVVTPGSIDFPGGVWDNVRQSDREFYDAVLGTISYGRFGLPEEVANAVVFLASEKASWITGSCLTIDGGQHKGNM